MIHIHPFPARMAPEIALSKIATLTEGMRVLDPMSGSGMVLSQSARNGLESFGYDLDPLARMISRAGATKVNEDKAAEALNDLIGKCKYLEKKKGNVQLDWIDGDKETKDFIDFWFYPKQRKQLRILSYYLVVKPFIRNVKILDLLKVSLSRLIITKEPKASLARDTAHSRPHRTISKNNFDIFSELPASLMHVFKALGNASIKINAKTYLGDARKMSRIEDQSIDAIITSPPYLNAIDYMRGHRLSLVWLGYRLRELANIRSASIGAEKAASGMASDIFVQAVKDFGLRNLDNRNLKMLDRYFRDLVLQLSESYRVLKRGATATYVIGNSTIRGNYIQNSEFLKLAGRTSGFDIIGETIREIPDNRRYMPVNIKGNNSLSSRMRTEHIVELSK